MSAIARETAPAGKLTLQVIRGPQVLVKDKWVPEPIVDLFRYDPKSELGRAIKAILHFIPRDMPGAKEAVAELIDRACSCVVIESALYGTVKRGGLWLAERSGWPMFEDYGLLGTKVVTNNGVGFIVDAFQNLVELESMKFHGLGTSSGSEAASDSALGTELTTEYTGNVRATGTTAETSANVYSTVATNTLDGTPGAALREHGVFSASTSGVLLDRTVFGAITLLSGDSLQTSYSLTFTAGS